MDASVSNLEICTSNYKQTVAGIVSHDFHDTDFSLLDIGCRDCSLKTMLPERCDYKGMDLFQNPEGSVDYVQGLGEGEVFADNTFNAVTALDVIEHIDDFEWALKEVVRTSGKAYITLPNNAHYSFRLRFLLSGRIGGKYTMHYGAGKDRHRWFTVLDEMDGYMEDFCREQGYEMRKCYFYPDTLKSRIIRGICKVFGVSAMMYVYRALYIITKK